jgi:PHD/YefM family antitoxin component YafN of YafNO toxin-antitoxin module
MGLLNNSAENKNNSTKWIMEQGKDVSDETNYLLSNRENAKWLLESIEQLKRGETVKYEL